MNRTIKIAELATMFYGMLFFISYYANFKYFHTFGIDINSYFTTSEILLFFLDESTFFLLTLVTGELLFLIPFFCFFYNKVNCLMESKINALTNGILVILSLLLGYVFYINVSWYYINVSLFADICFFLIKFFTLLLLSLAIIIMTSNKIKNHSKNKRRLYQIYGISYLLVFFSFSADSMNRSFNHYQNGINDYYLNFNYYDNERVETNDSINYIGNSSGHIFLFNVNTKETLVYDRTNIKNLVIMKTEFREIFPPKQSKAK